jgi:uncharacterized membrane protein
VSRAAIADGVAFRRRGRLLVAAAAVSWSLGGLMARSVGTDPWTTVFWRGLFCAAFLVAVTALREGRRTPRVFGGMGGTGVGMAVCFAIGSTCFIMALHRTSVANVLIIQSLSPFMAGLLGWIWMGERVAGRTWLAMGVALLGTAVMVSRYFYSTPASGSFGGDLLAYAVALTFALATVLLRRRRQVQMLPAAALAAALTSAIRVGVGDPARRGGGRPGPPGPLRRGPARARDDAVHRGRAAHPGGRGLADRGAGERAGAGVGVARARGEPGGAVAGGWRGGARRAGRAHPGRSAPRARDPG